MSDPYLGEIKIFGGNYAPLGWAFCDGSARSVTVDSGLFSLIGTTYGGDGMTSFNLPDLRGRVINHQNGHPIGTQAGNESVTLAVAQLPAHRHALIASNAAAAFPDPGDNTTLATADAGNNIYDTSLASAVDLAPNAVVPNAGGGLMHENRQPYLAMNYIIALVGVYPQQN